MGTSNWQNISYCVGIIKKIKPEKILDVGIGFGKWGFLSREYLDIWNERVHSKDWKIQIDGVEIFEKNIEEHQKKLYTNIYVENALDFIKSTNEQYDLIIIGDVLEHFSKEEGYNLLNNCCEKSTYIMLNIPLGNYWEQGIVYGNEFEEHKSFWKWREFKKYNIVLRKMFRDSQFRLFAVLLISKNKNRLNNKYHLYLSLRNLIYQYPLLFNFLKGIKNIFTN